MKTPMIKYESMQEAEKALGFSVLFSSVLGTGTITDIYTIDDKLLHLVLNNGLIYRMSKGSKDISGIYTNYPEVNEEKIGNYVVTCKGQHGRVFVILWTDGQYTFSMYTPYGVQPDRVKELVESLVEVDYDSLTDPMVEYDYLFEAEYAVGFSVPVASCMHDLSSKQIFVICRKVVEINYSNSITYRVAKGVSDISGDYTVYDCKEEFIVGKYHVLAKGNKDLYYTIIWNDDKLSFSLSCPHGVRRKAIEEFINSLCVIN